MAAKLFVLIPFCLGLYALVLLLFLQRTHFHWSFFLKGFLKGASSILPLLLLKYFGVIDKALLIVLCGTVWTYFVLALIEEAHKEILYLFKNEDNNLEQRVFTCIAIGAGFAFIENIVYASQFHSYSGMLLIAGTRFILNSTIHAACMAISVLYFERLKFLFPLASKRCLHFFSVFPATLIHAFFNLLYSWNVGYLSVPMVVLSIYTLKWLYVNHFFEDMHVATLSTKTTLNV